MPDVRTLKIIRPLDRNEIAVAQEHNTDDAVVYDADHAAEAPWLVATNDGHPIGRVVWFSYERHADGELEMHEHQLPTAEHVALMANQIDLTGVERADIPACCEGSFRHNSGCANAQATCEVLHDVLNEFVAAAGAVAFEDCYTEAEALRYYRSKKSLLTAIGQPFEPPMNDEDEVLDVESGQWLQAYCQRDGCPGKKTGQWSEPATLDEPGNEASCPVCLGEA